MSAPVHRIPVEELRAHAERLDAEIRYDNDKEHRIVITLHYLELIYSAGYEDGDAEAKVGANGI